jgi:hypothetical protein
LSITEVFKNRKNNKKIMKVKRGEVDEKFEKDFDSVEEDEDFLEELDLDD